MTTFFDAATIAIFATDTDDFFLEYGEDVVSGTRDGKTYSFEGMSVNVEDPVEGTTVTTTNQLTVELTINNREINGDVTTFTSSTCTGSCEAFEDTQCTVIGTFFGTEIKDVELEHAI